jgi:hypothetical protein
MQYDAEQGVVDLEATVVLDESKLPELVHEEVYPARVVPTISARVSCDSRGNVRCVPLSFPKRASSSSVRASLFSLVLTESFTLPFWI